MKFELLGTTVGPEVVVVLDEVELLLVELVCETLDELVCEMLEEVVCELLEELVCEVLCAPAPA